MAKKTQATPVEPQDTDEVRILIDRGVALSTRIKELTVEFEQEVKAPLKALGLPYTRIPGAGLGHVLVKIHRTLNKYRTAEMFPNGEAMELVITPAAARRAVEAKWAGKPGKIETKLAELYDVGQSLEFSQL